jgi:hypothetical protein
VAYNKRKYYYPGLYSLIGIFCYILFERKELRIERYTILDINMPLDNVRNDLEEFSIPFVKNSIKKMKQMRLTLDENQTTNDKKFKLIAQEARKLKYTLDTTSVLIVEMTNDITYSDFVRLLNICYEDEHKKYVLAHNEFMIFGEYPQEPKINIPELIECGTRDFIYLPEKSAEARLTSINSILGPYTSKTSMLLLGGWSILVFSFLHKRTKKIIT